MGHFQKIGTMNNNNNDKENNITKMEEGLGLC